MAPRESWRLVGALSIVAALVVAGCTTPGADGDGGDGDGGGDGGAIVTSCGGPGIADGGDDGEGNGTRDPLPRGPRAPLDALRGAEARDDQEDGLVIGTLLPLSGSLEAFGPDMEDAVKLAVQQVNAAGGVNGAEVRAVHRDDRTSDVTGAPQSLQELINEGATAVVGGAASSITGAILETASTNEVMVVTPSSTDPGLSARDNGGFFLRVPPSDALQGRVLARLVYEDGCRSASVLAVNNGYGVGLGNVFSEAFRDLGGTVAGTTRFAEGAQTFSTEVQRVNGEDSQAVVLIGYPGEGVPIMQAAFQRGVMQEKAFFFSEGVKDRENFVNGTGRSAGGDYILAGLRGTAPGAVETPGAGAFRTAFVEAYGHEPGLFAAESYDAAWMVALAAQCAGSNDGRGIAEHIRRVANRDGPADVAVSGAQATLALTTAGTGPDCGIDYQGAAHDFDFDEHGDPTDGRYTIWRVEDDGAIATIAEDLRP